MPIHRISLLKCYRKHATHKCYSKSARRNLLKGRMEKKLNKEAVGKFSEFITQENQAGDRRDPSNVLSFGFGVKKWFVNENNELDSNGNQLCGFYQGLVSKVNGNKFQACYYSQC